jgi:aspartate 1-decarboxylase
MTIQVLKSKIHRAKVTASDLNYEGSIAIDPRLIKAANLVEFEKVDVYNITNGKRFATYVIKGNDGEISLNGAAARLVQKGDLIIIASYIILENDELSDYQPKIILVDENNIIMEK